MQRLILTAAAPGENRELFLAAVTVLQVRQRGPVPDAAWSRLWNACGALLEHYGVESPEDLAVLETAA